MIVVSYYIGSRINKAQPRSSPFTGMDIPGMDQPTLISSPWELDHDKLLRWIRGMEETVSETRRSIILLKGLGKQSQVEAQEKYLKVMIVRHDDFCRVYQERFGYLGNTPKFIQKRK